MTCLVCEKETTNPRYCSRSCAATRNNLLYPKRHWVCRRCPSVSRPTPNARLCADCLAQKDRDAHKSLLRTVAEVKQRWRTSMRPWTDAVRSSARSLYSARSNCSACGYDKHVEVCHRRAIVDFPDTALVSEINDPTNILILCPNCHWEFDHGVLELTVGLEPTSCALQMRGTTNCATSA